MSDSRARLATHPISTLNKLILGIKKDLPLALSLKKKRYTKAELIEHLVMLGRAKLIDLSKIPALKKKAKPAAAKPAAKPAAKKAKPATHSMPDGTKMTGKTHTASSKPVTGETEEERKVRVKARQQKIRKKLKERGPPSSKPVTGETAGERQVRLQLASTEKKRKALEKSSQPKKSKPKKSKKSLDEMTLHKNQLKDDIREMKKFLAKKSTPVDSRGVINRFEGMLEKHQRELDEELEERGGRKLGYSEVFNATKELVKEHGDLFNEVEKKIIGLVKRYENRPLSKAAKALMGGGAEAMDKAEAKKKAKKAKKEKSPPAPPPVPEETPEERKVRVKARQKKIIKKLKERGPPSAAQLAARKKFGDAAKARSAAAKKK